VVEDVAAIGGLMTALVKTAEVVQSLSGSSWPLS
jgi:hypothetical protein